jgi:DNA-binding NarL/FixJ family response regulator
MALHSRVDHAAAPALLTSSWGAASVYTWPVYDGARTVLRLRRAQAAYEAATRRTETKRAERNTAVREALAAGWTHAEIARVTGLSRGRIGQIGQHRS